jgi:hypothetical protein
LQLQRAVDKITAARSAGIVTLIRRAMANPREHVMDPEIAQRFQFSTRVELGDKLFLEVCKPGQLCARYNNI